MEEWQWAWDCCRNLASPNLTMFWGWATSHTQGLAPPAMGFDGLFSLNLCFQGLKLNHCIEFCLFLMDHHCLFFLLAHFGNWVLHLVGPSFLCVCLLLFVTSEVTCPAPWHPGIPPTGHSRISALQDQVIKAGLGIFPRFGFQLLPKNCPCQVWFSHSGSLGGFTGSGEPCPCAVIPWGWRQGCCAALILSQNNAAGCVPDQILPVPGAPGVVRLDSSLVGEADRLPYEWGPCQPITGSLKCLNSATNAFLERPQLKVTC